MFPFARVPFWVPIFELQPHKKKRGNTKNGLQLWPPRHVFRSPWAVHCLKFRERGRRGGRGEWGGGGKGGEGRGGGGEGGGGRKGGGGKGGGRGAKIWF